MENEELDLEEDLIVVDEEDRKNVYSEEKITLPVMTAYEKSGVITRRVHQLNDGFRSFFSEEELKTRGISKSYDIAMLEFSEGKLPPYMIKRTLPNGRYELWKHEDFQFFP